MDHTYIYNIYVKKYSSWAIGLFCSWHMALFLPIDHPCCHNSQQLGQRWRAHEVLRKGLLFSRAPLSLSHLSLYGKTGILGKGGWPFPKTATLSLCVPFRQEKRKNSNLVFKMSQTNRKQTVKNVYIYVHINDLQQSARHDSCTYVERRCELVPEILFDSFFFFYLIFTQPMI